MSLGNSPGEYVEIDPDVRAMRERIRQMEEESSKLKEMMLSTSSSSSTQATPEEADARSIYIGNVDYSVTVDELTAHFAPCGAIARCTILCDKWSGHPKGFAYLEFVEETAVNKAVQEMNETLLKNRLIKVLPKRTNVFGFNQQGGSPTGSGSSGGPVKSGYHRGGRGRRGYRGGRTRGRGRGSFAPY
jgi:polyadenylate-binding protein 2